MISRSFNELPSHGMLLYQSHIKPQPETVQDQVQKELRKALGESLPPNKGDASIPLDVLNLCSRLHPYNWKVSNHSKERLGKLISQNISSGVRSSGDRFQNCPDPVLPGTFIQGENHRKVAKIRKHFSGIFRSTAPGKLNETGDTKRDKAGNTSPMMPDITRPNYTMIRNKIHLMQTPAEVAVHVLNRRNKALAAAKASELRSIYPAPHYIYDMSNTMENTMKERYLKNSSPIPTSISNNTHKKKRVKSSRLHYTPEIRLINNIPRNLMHRNISTAQRRYSYNIKHGNKRKKQGGNIHKTNSLSSSKVESKRSHSDDTNSKSSDSNDVNSNGGKIHFRVLGNTGISQRQSKNTKTGFLINRSKHTEAGFYKKQTNIPRSNNFSRWASTQRQPSNIFRPLSQRSIRPFSPAPWHHVGFHHFNFI